MNKEEFNKAIDMARELLEVLFVDEIKEEPCHERTLTCSACDGSCNCSFCDNNGKRIYSLTPPQIEVYLDKGEVVKWGCWFVKKDKNGLYLRFDKKGHIENIVNHWVFWGRTDLAKQTFKEISITSKEAMERLLKGEIVYEGKVRFGNKIRLDKDGNTEYFQDRRSKEWEKAPCHYLNMYYTQEANFILPEEE